MCFGLWMCNLSMYYSYSDFFHEHFERCCLHVKGARPYTTINQHWPRHWLGTVKQQTITCIDVVLSLWPHTAPLGYNDPSISSCFPLQSQGIKSPIVLPFSALEIVTPAIESVRHIPEDQLLSINQLLSTRWPGGEYALLYQCKDNRTLMRGKCSKLGLTGKSRKEAVSQEMSSDETLFYATFLAFPAGLVNWKWSNRMFVPVSLQWRHTGLVGVSNQQPNNCLLKRLFRRRSKKTSKLRVTGLCVGNSPVTGEFPAQMASNAENVPIWWRHHDGNAIMMNTGNKSNKAATYRNRNWAKTKGQTTCIFVGFTASSTMQLLLMLQQIKQKYSNV